MKKFLLLLAVVIVALMVSPTLSAQTTTDPTNVYAAGATWNTGGTPAVAGTGLWAHKLADNDGKPTFSFTAIDALPSNLKPFTVSTNFSVGVAQKVLTIGKFPIYIPVAGGPAFTGQNVGYNWNTGVLTSIKIGKGSFRIYPNVRIVRNNVDGTGDYHPLVGILFGSAN